MNVLDDWINSRWLTDEAIADVYESVMAKPYAQYAVLDDFFKVEKIESLIAHHKSLPFSEELDRLAHSTGEWLPYDGAVVFARPGVHYGSDLFFAEEWHRYLCRLCGCKVDFPVNAEVKLRWHKPDATGFWIHTDGTIRSAVAILYFNKGWRVEDGGLLQLWKVDDELAGNSAVIDWPSGKSQRSTRLDVLTKHKRIRTATPGGGFSDGGSHDVTLIDQVVPAYNRLFLCNYQNNPAYHSVTPSNGRERTGFVQWLNGAKV